MRRKVSAWFAAAACSCSIRAPGRPMALGHSSMIASWLSGTGSTSSLCCLLLQLGFQLRNFGVSLRACSVKSLLRQRGVARQPSLHRSGVDPTVDAKRVGGLVGIGVRFLPARRQFAQPRFLPCQGFSANFPRVFSAATMAFSNALICAAVFRLRLRFSASSVSGFRASPKPLASSSVSASFDGSPQLIHCLCGCCRFLRPAPFRLRRRTLSA